MALRMGSVRTPQARAWVLSGPFDGGIPNLLLNAAQQCTHHLGVTVWDLFYVGLTIVVFGVLLLILKGVERFER
jgi:hypothetical protein